MNKKYTILIIDDKTENLHYLNTILKDKDYIIRATTDSSFAINWNDPEVVDTFLFS